MVPLERISLELDILSQNGYGRDFNKYSESDASRRPAPTPQDFGRVSFLWGLSREICQKVDVCGEVLSWETTTTTCVWRLQLCFLGRSCGILGASWLAGSHIGAKFGHFVGDVEAKSGYGRSC